MLDRRRRADGSDRGARSGRRCLKGKRRHAERESQGKRSEAFHERERTTIPSTLVRHKEARRCASVRLTPSRTAPG